MKSTALIIILSFWLVNLFAQNPIVPPGMYIADPEAHVWDDGKLYIYGSRDESDEYWCSHTYHVLSTSDLLLWNFEENAFSSKEPYDQVKYHDRLLFAPDVAYYNGSYYLYYCSPTKHGEGVATSKSPYGPFISGKLIEGAHQIDPAVLIDDDGEGYYFWGQGIPKAAKLTADKMAIDTASIILPLEESANKFFHEGASVRKIGDTYYLVFADESRGKPTCLGYATSKSPLGPYKYQGVIIDNNGSDPKVWNNHGSIENFNGQWYVFYHRSTHSSQKFRKACVEPININKDGFIDEVEMTSQGVGGPLNGFEHIQAEWACGLYGNVRVEDFKPKDLWYGKLAKIHDQDHAVFKYIDFSKDATKFIVKTLENTKGGKIEIWIDGIDKGELIGTCDINPIGNDVAYQITECTIKKTKGKHAVYLKFIGDNDYLFDIDWFSFGN